MSAFSLISGFKLARAHTAPSLDEGSLTGQDVTINFLSADVCFFFINIFIIKLYLIKGLPKMDYFGSADPYFIARIDGQVTYRWEKKKISIPFF